MDLKFTNMFVYNFSQEMSIEKGIGIFKLKLRQKFHQKNIYDFWNTSHWFLILLIDVNITYTKREIVIWYIHTTNININTKIVLFGGKCPTPQTGLWSVPVNDAISCEVCVPVTPKEIYSSATSKISGSSNKLWVTTFYLYTVVVDSFLFSLIALRKEKKKSNDFISSDNLSAGDVEKITHFLVIV